MTPPLAFTPSDEPRPEIGSATADPEAPTEVAPVEVELPPADPEALADDPRTPPVVEDLGPIRAVERIAEMDILRGFALLGICVINLQAFLGPFGISGDQPLFPSWYDRTAEFLINLFGSGKFNAMFSFLFGVGFAIQMERAAAKKKARTEQLHELASDSIQAGRVETKGTGFVGMYLRRLAALFLFGAAHLILLWDGDVLHIYAAIGVPLILFRNLRDRWLWGIVALTLVGPILFFVAMMAIEGEPTAEKKEKNARQGYDRAVETLETFGRGNYLVPPYVTIAEKERREKAGEVVPAAATVPVRAHSTYPATVSHRLREWVRQMRKGAWVFWAIMATTLIIGFIAGRRRIFQDIPRHLGFIRKVTWISGVIGLGIAFIFATAVLLSAGHGKDSVVGIIGGLAYIFGRPFLAAFYMGALILMARTDRFGKLLAPLALVGRMPLTNYLTHSLVFSLLFYGYAVGWYYRVGPALSLVIAFTLYALQVAFSNWWMKRFRFGPMEWLWRAMTYGKRPSMALS